MGGGVHVQIMHQASSLSALTVARTPAVHKIDRQYSTSLVSNSLYRLLHTSWLMGKLKENRRTKNGGGLGTRLSECHMTSTSQAVRIQLSMVQLGSLCPTPHPGHFHACTTVGGRFSPSFLHLNLNRCATDNFNECVYQQYNGWSKQASIHTRVCNAVTLVWGSLRLTPIMVTFTMLNPRDKLDLQSNLFVFKSSTVLGYSYYCIVGKFSRKKFSRKKKLGLWHLFVAPVSNPRKSSTQKILFFFFFFFCGENFRKQVQNL